MCHLGGSHSIVAPLEGGVGYYRFSTLKWETPYDIMGYHSPAYMIILWICSMGEEFPPVWYLDFSKNGRWWEMFSLYFFRHVPPHVSPAISRCPWPSTKLELPRQETNWVSHEFPSVDQCRYNLDLIILILDLFWYLCVNMDLYIVYIFQFANFMYFSGNQTRMVRILHGWSELQLVTARSSAPVKICVPV